MTSESSLLSCGKGHKPRFYLPKIGNPYFTNWGWKRKCNDFEMGRDVYLFVRPNAVLSGKPPSPEL
jgi:hypothetical protein